MIETLPEMLVYPAEFTFAAGALANQLQFMRFRSLRATNADVFPDRALQKSLANAAASDSGAMTPIEVDDDQALHIIEGSFRILGSTEMAVSMLDPSDFWQRTLALQAQPLIDHYRSQAYGFRNRRAERLGQVA